MAYRNSEQKKAYGIKWRKDHKEYVDNYNKNYRKTHKAKIKKHAHEYYLTHLKQRKQYLDLHKDDNLWYNSHKAAKQRCTNPNLAAYKYYGGRGIKFLLTREQTKFLWYRDNACDMKRHSLDRENNDGDYTLENCRFIEMSENTKKKWIDNGDPGRVRMDKVMDFLKSKKDTWVTPTAIGMEALGQPYVRASTYAHYCLKKLINLGLVEYKYRGKYRAVSNQIT